SLPAALPIWLQAEIARRLGCRLVHHRLERYAVPLEDEADGRTMLSLRGFLRLSLIVPATLVGIPLQALAVRLDSRAARIIPLVYHGFICRVLGIRIKVEGRPPNGREAALILANHVSWLDIPVIE